MAKIYRTNGEVLDIEPKNGDYCRLYQVILDIKDGVNVMCDDCIIRCIHSGDKSERDYLIKKKKK